jgi:uncharacterized protein (TIGR03083 family)
MSEYVDALRETHVRIATLVGGLSAEQLQMLVPACPEWRVHDLVSHLTGMAVDFCGDMAVVMGPGFWDHDEVDRREILARRGRPTGEVLAEWTDVSARFEEVVGGAEPPLAGAIVGDFICHEHDLRGAVGLPAPSDAADVRLGIDVYARSLARRLDAAGLGALVLRAGDREWTVGEGTPAASVTAAPFEMFRALTGRRTREQVAAFEWTGQSDRYVGEFSVFDWPEAPLNE